MLQLVCSTCHVQFLAVWITTWATDSTWSSLHTHTDTHTHRHTHTKPLQTFLRSACGMAQGSPCAFSKPSWGSAPDIPPASTQAGFDIINCYLKSVVLGAFLQMQVLGKRKVMGYAAHSRIIARSAGADLQYHRCSPEHAKQLFFIGSCFKQCQAN